MRLELRRTTYTRESTVGELFVDGVFECYVLEDVARAPRSPKVFGRTAIPAGTYGVVVTMSNRFRRLMPLLLNVPGYAGVRIHSGNTAADTEGCLLLGLDKKPDFVGRSREAYSRFFPRLQDALAAGPVTLTIRDTRPPLL